MKVIPADSVEPGQVFRPVRLADRPYAVAGTAVFDRLVSSEPTDTGKAILMHQELNGTNCLPRFHPCEVFD